MDLVTIITIIATIVSTIAAQETYENSSQLCDHCTCIKGKKFTLDCQNRSLQHMIANWPEHDTPLIATFSYNNMANVEILPDSDLVTKVVLSHCGVKSLDNGAFKTVRYMTYLDLSYNFLTTEEIAPEKFKGPYNNTVYEPLAIEDLNLAYNQIHSLPQNIFEHMESTLKQLNLEGNRFKVLDPPTQVALSGLSNLEVLNLGYNDLTELVGDAIKTLTKLRILNLAGNKLDFVPETLTLLSSSLETLYLDNNLIFEITDESFLGVKGIAMLSLTNLPHLYYVGPNAFAPLKNLTTLYLSDNSNLTEINQDAFGVNQTLERLYLHNNSLRSLHYNLTKWSALKLFSLTDNELYCDCDLFEISRNLSWEIKRDKNGPYCINPNTDTSLMVYNLTEEACKFKGYCFRTIHIIQHHYRIMKLIFVVVSTVFFITVLVALFVAYLKFRRYRTNKNYPFASQLMYSSLRDSNTN